MQRLFEAATPCRVFLRRWLLGIFICSSLVESSYYNLINNYLGMVTFSSMLYPRRPVFYIQISDALLRTQAAQLPPRHWGSESWTRYTRWGKKRRAFNFQIYQRHDGKTLDVIPCHAKNQPWKEGHAVGHQARRWWIMHHASNALRLCQGSFRAWDERFQMGV